MEESSKSGSGARPRIGTKSTVSTQVMYRSPYGCTPLMETPRACKDSPQGAAGVSLSYALSFTLTD